MKTYLEPGEIELLEKAATNLRDRLLIRILFKLGCRISEALGIGVEDIDFAQGTITIEHLKARVRFSCPRLIGLHRVIAGQSPLGFQAFTVP